MELKVRYTDTFEITFKALIAFIEGNWGEKVAKDFIKQAEKVISNITVFPYMYKATRFDESIRIAQVKKLSTLYYQVTDQYIILFYIVDSRQEPFWV